MIKNPSWKLPEVFVLIIPKLIRIHQRVGTQERSDSEDIGFNNDPNTI